VTRVPSNERRKSLASLGVEDQGEALARPSIAAPRMGGELWERGSSKSSGWSARSSTRRGQLWEQELQERTSQLRHRVSHSRAWHTVQLSPHALGRRVHEAGR
jgi:hypothetical protein